MSELTVGTLSGLAANSYVIDVASGSQLTQPGMVLQVVSTTKTDVFTTTSTSFTDITGLSASITPTSASSKVLVMVSMNGGIDVASGNAWGLLLRDATSIFVGDTLGSRIPAASSFDFPSGTGSQMHSYTHLDSPATTSAVTYKVQVRCSAGVAVVNRSINGTDGATRFTGASSITLMEIAG